MDEQHEVPVGTPMASGRPVTGRRAMRDYDMACTRVHQFPPATDRGGRRSRPNRRRQGLDPNKPTPNALRAVIDANKAREDAARQWGAKARGVADHWQPVTQYVEGQRIRPLTETGRWYECARGGVTEEKEPKWLGEDRIEMRFEGGQVLQTDKVQDGQVVWTPIPIWNGRQGYGFMGMKTLCRAMRAHPWALETGSARQKAKNAARRSRQRAA